jgi:hypothetical protein
MGWKTGKEREEGQKTKLEASMSIVDLKKVIKKVKAQADRRLTSKLNPKST